MKKLIFTFLSALIFTGIVNAQQWDWAYDGDGVANPKMVMLNNYIYLTGTYTNTCKVRNQVLNSTAGGSGFLMKLDANANTIWTKTFDASAMRISGVKAWNNGIYIAGSFEGNLTGSSVSLSSAGDYDAFFAGFSENGTLQLAKRDGDGKYQDIVDFDVDSTFIVIGQFEKGSVISGQNLTSTCLNNSNVFLARYDLSGTNLWVKEIAGDSTQSGIAMSVRFDRNRTIIAEGDFGVGVMSYAGVNDGLCQACKPLLRFDASGSYMGLLVYPQGSGGFDDSYDLAIDAANHIYNVQLSTCGSCGGADLRLVKYNSAGTAIWDKTLTGNTYASTSATGASYPYRLSQSGADIYISGKIFNTVHFKGGDTISGSYFYIARFDTLAGFKSVRTASISGSSTLQSQINGMVNDAGGNVYVTGLVDAQTTFGTNVLNSANSAGKFYIARLGAQALAVQENEKENSFTISPNPSSGKILVNVRGNDGSANVCVYNMLGHCILFQPAQNASVLDLSAQPKGVYFISLESKSGRDVKRVVLE